MNIIGFLVLVVTGFTACAEFASYALVHPIIRKMPQEHHIRFEQGSLRTYGVIMPALMPICVLLSVIFAIQTQEREGLVHTLRWATAAAFIISTVTTIVFNVPINTTTRKWDPENPPSDWKEVRERWGFYQGIRSWLLLLGFVFLCLSVTL
jgi:hypothetical protein